MARAAVSAGCSVRYSGSDIEAAAVIACVFHSPSRSAVVFAELARTELERARGLAFRSWLPPDHGMLFAFDAPAPRRLWMRDTLIPLDMIFVDSAGVVVHVEEGAEPLSLELRGTDRPAQFVVEVGAGWVRAHGIDVGTVVAFYDVPHAPFKDAECARDTLGRGGLMIRQWAIFAVLLAVLGAGCKSCSNPGGSCGNQGNCPTGQVRICQSKCVTPLPTGSPCSPTIDCNNPQTCDPYRDACLPAVEGFTCQPSFDWGNACTPGVDDANCGAGLFCLAREDFGPIDWPPNAPPGFCSVDRWMGASCVGSATHRPLVCDSGLYCASDGICHTQCASDSDCPCYSGQSCVDPASVSPPSQAPGKACFLCADRGLQTGACDATHPCCNANTSCEYVYYRGGDACCNRRGQPCNNSAASYCCGSDVCYADSGASSSTCHACTETGASCTTSAQCCGFGAADCCGGKCVNRFTDINNCGSCGHVCPSYPNAQPPSCYQGTCTFQCNAHFGNCNNVLTDGCEADLLDDPNNCGYCGRRCGSGYTCANGTCTSTGGGSGGTGGGSCLSEGQRTCVPAKYTGAHCCGSDSGNPPPAGQPDLECVYQTCRSCTRELGGYCDGLNGHPYLCCMVRNPGDPDITCEWDPEQATDICHLQNPPPGERPVTRTCAPPGASCRVKTETGFERGPCCSGTCSAAGICPRTTTKKK